MAVKIVEELMVVVAKVVFPEKVFGPVKVFAPTKYARLLLSERSAVERPRITAVVMSKLPVTEKLLDVTLEKTLLLAERLETNKFVPVAFVKKRFPTFATPIVELEIVVVAKVEVPDTTKPVEVTRLKLKLPEESATGIYAELVGVLVAAIPSKYFALKAYGLAVKRLRGERVSPFTVTSR